MLIDVGLFLVVEVGRLAETDRKRERQSAELRIAFEDVKHWSVPCPCGIAWLQQATI